MTGFAIRCIDLTLPVSQCNARLKVCEQWLNDNHGRRWEAWWWSPTYGTVIILDSKAAMMFKLAFGV